MKKDEDDIIKKRKAKIKKKTKELTKIFENLDENKKKVIETLIERAAFMTVHLAELEEELNRDGWTEEYQNGQNQKGLKKSAAAEAHVSLVKNLAAIIKQLTELCPASTEKSKLQAFLDE